MNPTLIALTGFVAWSLFLLVLMERMLGFCQLYPTFCSVEAKPIYVLYDLFVHSSARKSGAGKNLLKAAEARAAADGKVRIDLTTAKTNKAAQSLYESLGGGSRRSIFLPQHRSRWMKLIGMLDSPYVRRVAISLQLLGLRFAHQSLSVFRTFAEFQQINPVVKAPTLVCDDGTVLMDSTLILQYAETLAQPRTLMPSDVTQLQQDLRCIGLALAAMEKSVQIVYERGLRPPEKLHE